MDIAAQNRHIGFEELVLACLSLASGCTDVLSFLKLGDVFTSAMTDNTALLAIAIGRGQMLAASRSLTALIGFVLGAALATLTSARGDPEQNTQRRLRHLLLLETVFLGGCAALWSVSSDPIQGSALYGVILLSAVSMGIQGVVSRFINASSISTIVFTSALIRIVMSLTDGLVRSSSAPISSAGFRAHLGTFGAYGFGAGLAGILVGHSFRAMLWAPLAAVLFALGCELRSPSLSSRSCQGIN